MFVHIEHGLKFRLSIPLTRLFTARRFRDVMSLSTQALLSDDLFMGVTGKL